MPLCPTHIECLGEFLLILLGLCAQDIKDGFFCVWPAPENQSIFAFEWGSSQYTWTRLPQGFKNSPTIFKKALASDLKAFIPTSDHCVLLQYIDDLLLAVPTKEEAFKAQKASFVFCGRLAIRYLRKRHKSVAKEQGILALTSLQGSMSLDVSKKRLCVAFLDLTLDDKCRSF